MPAKEITQNSYLERINRVISYINNHLDSEMTIDTLAEISHFSPFHFHRIMKAFLGESLRSYIIRQRMELSVQMLRYTSTPIAEIAYGIGYDTPSSYNKAFKNAYGISPNEFRKIKPELKMEKFISEERKSNFKPDAEIINVEPKKVIYTSLFGNYTDMDYSIGWDKVCGFAGKNNLFGRDTEMIGVCFDDPDVTPAGKQRYDACLSIGGKSATPEGEIGVQTLEGGKFAKFRHVGPYDYLSEVYSIIFAEWLPKSGYELRFVPNWEVYVNAPEQTKPEDLITDIYIPIQ
jgi:AraC family transcriptional regulator